MNDRPPHRIPPLHGYNYNVNTPLPFDEIESQEATRAQRQTTLRQRGNRLRGEMTMSHDGFMKMKGARRRRSRRSKLLASSLFVVSTLTVGQLPSTTCNAGPVDYVFSSLSSLVAVKDRGLAATVKATFQRPSVRENTRDRRLDHESYTANNNNICIQGKTSLHPGDTLQRGEFLCHGTLRFGIDASHGQFVLGFAETDDTNNSTNNNTNKFTTGNTTVADADADDATITIVAWTGIPTMLFMDKSRPFHNLTLSEDGNLFGYDVHGEEIYDSNYDYRNRLDVKEDGSILCLSSNCGDLANMGAEEGGRMCVALTSPQMPGKPNGMVTWGVEVHAENIVAMEPTIPTPAPFEYVPDPITGPVPTPAPFESFLGLESIMPTSRPTRLGTPRPTPNTAAAVESPTNPPYRTSAAANIVVEEDSSGNIFLEEDSSENSRLEEGSSAALSLESTSIIWGKVWHDSNRNGQMDFALGERSVKDLEVRLFQCSEDVSTHDLDESTSDDVSTVSAYDLVESTRRTDSEGMFIFQVPAGQMYKLQFDIHSPEYVYSSGGQDTDTDIKGWTSCESSNKDRPIQWNAGLYSMQQEMLPEIVVLPPDVPAAAASTPAMDDESTTNLNVEQTGQLPTTSPATAVARQIMSSIGGFVYLDVDESGTLDSKEHAAAVGGYTVNDAVIVVSLTDCQTSEVIGSLDVAFPGTYTFVNLTEGLYRLGYEMVVLARSSVDPMPLYSFINDGGGTYSTSFKTECGKLGQNEVNEDGNVGLRMAPYEITAMSPGSGPVGPDQTSLDEMESMSPPSIDESLTPSTATTEIDEPREEVDSKSPIAPALIGAIVTLTVLVTASIFFFKHRGGDFGDTFPFLGRGSKNEVRGDLRSLGSSMIEGDTSMISATPSVNPTAIGSLVVETGKSIAEMTPGNESDRSGEEETYTGIEFALKSSGGSVDNGGGGGNDSAGCRLLPTSDSPSHIEQIHEERSEGYEVYDDEDDEEKNASGTADYGPVISGMIAKYSQKTQGGQSSDDEPRNQEGQGDSMIASHKETQDNQQAHTQNQDQRHNHDHHQVTGYGQNQSQNYSHHHQGVEQKNQDYSHYQTQPQYHEERAKATSNNHDSNVDHSQYENHYHHQGYHSNGAYYNEETSAGGSSRCSSDPPAASYRDIPAMSNNTNAAMVGWDTGVQAPNAGWETTTGVFTQQQTVADAQNHNQYAANSAAYTAENYDSNNQYMANNDGTYADYESNQYVANNSNNEGNAYATTNYDSNRHPQDYDEHDCPHQIDSDSDSDLDSSSTSSDEEEEEEEGGSASRWSKSSSTTNPSHSSNLSSYGSSAAEKPQAAQARRARSNPRDDRLDDWGHHQAAIPENSTMEFNAHTISSNKNHELVLDDDCYGSNQMGAVASLVPTIDDNKSVHSSGSDQSADPPGASYKNLHRQFPPPLPTSRRTTPPPPPRPRRAFSSNKAKTSPRRGGSVPPPPPPRIYHSPPPR